KVEIGPGSQGNRKAYARSKFFGPCPARIELTRRSIVEVVGMQTPIGGRHGRSGEICSANASPYSIPQRERSLPPRAKRAAWRGDGTAPPDRAGCGQTPSAAVRRRSQRRLRL